MPSISSYSVNEVALHTVLQFHFIYVPSNDTPSSPHECNAAVVQSPVKLLSCFSHQHEAPEHTIQSWTHIEPIKIITSAESNSETS